MKNKKYRIIIRNPHKIDKGGIKLINAMIVLKINNIDRVVTIGVPIIFLMPLKLGCIKASKNMIISEMNGRYWFLIKYC